jgi:IS30 family transposase
MEGNARIWFTPKQKAELWERWKSGQCVADIARALERRNKSGVYRVLALNGGIAPALRRRALVTLRLEEREDISRGIAAGRPIRRIAQGLGRSPSTVSREIRRNGGRSAYRASEADTRAWERGLRPAARGRTALSKVLMRACVTNCSTVRSSTRCVKPRSSSKAGAVTTTPSVRMPRSATSHLHRRSSCRHHPRGRLRYADQLRRPRWRYRQLSTNIPLGPLNAGRSRN